MIIYYGFAYMNWQKEGESERMQILPVLVLMVLFFVMMFGIGFILNMLMKTTWFPSYLFVIVLIPVVIFTMWNQESMSLGAHLGTYRLVDYLTGIAGLVGAVMSGWTIKKLRLGGYRMF